MLRASPEPIRNNPLALEAKHKMSIPDSTPNPAAQEHNCASRETCTVYSVACDDCNGTYAQVFVFETEALVWLAENAEGPNDHTRAELLELVLIRDHDAFWLLLEQSRDDLATYRVEAHDLQLQPNLF
jgi:hypothetical protein